MIAHCDVRLAAPGDASAIAVMSRDFVEQGLGWRWTPARVLNSIRDTATNVAVAYDKADLEKANLVGYGIMKYGDEEAHLNLLAVKPPWRRQGIGAAIVSWLENSALTAGIGAIYLEARSANVPAREFYKKLGYTEMALARRYYWGREDAVRIAKDLWR
jgi:ribosomal-protein-alanine N-acetyltransferase